MNASAPLTREEVHRRWWAFAAMNGGVFMAFLDIQIVTSSLNQIQAGLLATNQEIAWVQTSYLIAEVIAIPLSGYLSRLMSTRIYFTVSVLGFTVASVACSLAWNIESMMVFRAIQGFLGGGMIPSSFAALYLLFPVEKRVVPQIVAGAVSTAAPTLGPVIGGWVTGLWSWHWLFLINVVPGLLVALAVWALVRVDDPDWKLWKVLDVQGVVSMAVFLGALEWVLEEGPQKGWFEDGAIVAWTCIGVVSAVTFFTRVVTYEHPIVDLRSFRDSNFSIAILAAALLSVSLLGVNYIIPLFLGQVRGYDSVQIGNTLMVSGLSMLFAAAFVGPLARKVDLRWLYVIGVGFSALGTWQMAHLTDQSGHLELASGQFFRGIGVMMSLVACSSTSLMTVPPALVKNGSAMYSLTRNLGGALGLALINTVMQYRTTFHTQHLSESLRQSREPVRDALAAGQGSDLGLAMIAHRLQEQVAVLTFNDALIVLFWSILAAAPLLLFTRRTRFTPSREQILEAEAHL